MRLAFLIPAPDYPEPWRWAFDVEARVLEEAGATVDPVPWTEAGTLDGYDLVLPLVAWGYHERYPEWLALLDRFEASGAPIINPPSVLRWSSDKAYLAELGAAGLPTVPTMVADALGDADLANARALFGTNALVVKPPVSGGAYGTFRVGRDDPVPDFSRGRRMIVQPLIEAISTNGEYSLMLFDGVLSHAVLKRPAPGEFRVQPHLGGTTEPCDIPEGAEALAKAALAEAPAAATYARVDMLRDGNGELRLMELELVEPALFLDHAPDRARRMFADAVLTAAERFRAA